MNRKLGGAEQAFLDYHQALTLEKHQVINITSSFAQINKKTQSITLPNLFPWCIISKIYLKFLVFYFKPDLIIAHGGRAVNFSSTLGKGRSVLGVTHSYSVKHILKCDYIIALDESLKNHLQANGYDASRIFIVPNMVALHTPKVLGTVKKRSYIIGAMGRFVPEKGFNYLIEAISLMKARGYNIKLKLGGSGELEADLKAQMRESKLEQNIEFIGWTQDKDAFFKEVDIFCIPSVFETFGIVALEAMSRGVPIVTTSTGGLAHIFEHEVDGLMVATSSELELADSLARLIDKPVLAKKLGENAYAKIAAIYDIEIVAKLLNDVVNRVCVRHPGT
jgi:glycosyltransferase involved in cell wall biosynthesis